MFFLCLTFANLVIYFVILSLPPKNVSLNSDNCFVKVIPTKTVKLNILSINTVIF